jgi:CDP-glucose 4,6-dehydratase
MLAERLYSDGPDFAEAWNFGPDDKGAKNVEWIADSFCKLWGSGASFSVDKDPQLHEANYLKLDCSKANTLLDWHPRWNLDRTIDSIIEWHKAYLNGENIEKLCYKQIDEFLNENFA